ncbi:hypothetical protein PMIN03_013041 [Paraphaeosphaeria minitans]
MRAGKRWTRSTSGCPRLTWYEPSNFLLSFLELELELSVCPLAGKSSTSTIAAFFATAVRLIGRGSCLLLEASASCSLRPGHRSFGTDRHSYRRILVDVPLLPSNDGSSIGRVDY